MIVNSKVRLAIRNRSGSDQVLPAGCSIMPMDLPPNYPVPSSVVPKNYFCVIPAGVQITIPDGSWILSAPEWAPAVANQNYVPLPNTFWADGSALNLGLPTVLVISS